MTIMITHSDESGSVKDLNVSSSSAKDSSLFLLGSEERSSLCFLKQYKKNEGMNTIMLQIGRRNGNSLPFNGLLS